MTPGEAGNDKTEREREAVAAFRFYIWSILVLAKPNLNSNELYVCVI